MHIHYIYIYTITKPSILFLNRTFYQGTETGLMVACILYEISLRHFINLSQMTYLLRFASKEYMNILKWLKKVNHIPQIVSWWWWIHVNSLANFMPDGAHACQLQRQRSSYVMKHSSNTHHISSPRFCGSEPQQSLHHPWMKNMRKSN